MTEFQVIRKAVRKCRRRVREATERYQRDMQLARRLQHDPERFQIAVSILGDKYSEECDRIGDEYEAAIHSPLPAQTARESASAPATPGTQPEAMRESGGSK